VAAALVATALGACPDTAPLERPAETTWSQVAAGHTYSCGLTDEGRLWCWGCSGEDYREEAGPCKPPLGEFVEMTAEDHGCALREDGAVACWGCDGYDYGQCTPPPTAFVQVATGSKHTCGLTGGGEVECWGYSLIQECGELESDPRCPPEGAFAGIDVGGSFSCGTRADRTVECWGDGDFPGELAGVPVDRLAVGSNHLCVLHDGGELHCWNHGYGEKVVEETGPFAKVAAANWGVCALDPNGAATCFGAAGGSGDPPDEPMSEIAPGFMHVCGILETGEMTCWGRNQYDQVGVPGSASGIVRDGTPW